MWPFHRHKWYYFKTAPGGQKAYTVLGRDSPSVWAVCLKCREVRTHIRGALLKLIPERGVVFSEGTEGFRLAKSWDYLAPIRARADEILASMSDEKRGRVALAEKGGEVALADSDVTHS